MPVKSEKQRRFMYASLAGKTDVPPSVAKKFVGPDAHKADGGAVKESEMKSKKMMFGAANKVPYKAQEKRHVAAMKKAGVPKGIVREEKKEAGLKMGGAAKGYAKGGSTRADGCATKGRTKTKMVKMAGGGKC